MKKVYSLLFFVFLFSSLNAQELSTIYKEGNGHIYKMTSPHFTENQVSIYNAKVEKNKLWIEIYIENTTGFIKLGMWQQFEFEKGKGALSLNAGYIKTKEMDVSEKLPKSHLAGSRSLKMTQFLVGSEEDIKKYYKGTEEVTVPAGTVDAKRYQVKGDGQTIDFWLAVDSKPLTMVKLVSQGKKKVHAYTMELVTLATNIGAVIDPKKAKPLSESMRKMLEETPLN